MAGVLVKSDVSGTQPACPVPAGALAEAYAEASAVALLALQGSWVLGHNRAFVRMCGAPPHLLERATLESLVEWLSERRDELSLALAKLLSASESGQSGEIACSDGRTLEWRKVAIAGGVGWVWGFADVSETRQMAAALLDSASWLRMLEVHTDGVLLELDADARIVGLWGPSRAFFDEADSVLEGKRMSDALAGPEGEALDTQVRRVFASGTREEYEYSMEVGGAQRVFATSALLMPGGEDVAQRVTLMIRDVTEHARMQAQLLQVERLASVGLLAAGVAHEINNPLAYVILNLERLRSGLARLQRGHALPELAELRDAIEMSAEGAARVQTIVRDLSRFSRAEAGLGLPVDVHRSLDFAIAMAEPELRSRALLVRDFGVLPVVRASESRLNQIFLNLIINAAHAIPEGQLSQSEIRVVTRTDGDGCAVIEVRDTGLGMSAAVLRHVFEPFYTTKPPGVGTGLGLTICQDIATALGGQIEVESVEGQGSVFRVRLPPAVDPER